MVNRLQIAWLCARHFFGDFLFFPIHGFLYRDLLFDLTIRAIYSGDVGRVIKSKVWGIAEVSGDLRRVRWVKDQGMLGDRGWIRQYLNPGFREGSDESVAELFSRFHE